MHQSNTPLKRVFGYLSTLETAEYGYFGGYLVVNELGRPLEFHCTAPVRPSRAQEILYGPTLQPYLLGEQMGGALLREAKLKPAIVLTDQLATLSLRESFDWPLAMIASQSDDSATDSPVKLWAQNEVGRVTSFVASGYQIHLPANFESDQSRVTGLLEELAKHVELIEPFDRIHEAIREASRIGQRDEESYQRDEESYGQAAA